MQRGLRPNQNGLGPGGFDLAKVKMCHFPFLTAVDKTPGEYYCPSPRPYPSRIEEPEDPQGLAARRVVDGVIRWRRQKVFVGKGLNGERVGLEEIGKWRWRVRFSFYELGLLEERKGRLLSPSAVALRAPSTRVPPGRKVLPMCLA